jgi:hypothetical protein
MNKHTPLMLLLSLCLFQAGRLEAGGPTPARPETLDDPYAPPAGDFPAPRGPSGAPPGSVQVNVDANGLNIIGDAANEPSIAIDPTNPLRMAIGWRQFNTIASNFREAGYGYTTDGGATWTVPGPLTPGVFRRHLALRHGVEMQRVFARRQAFQVEIDRHPAGPGW